MNVSRLSSIEPDLALYLSTLPPQELREISGAIAKWVLGRMPTDDERVAAAVGALSASGSIQERDRLQPLIEELDEVAWDLQDLAEEGNADFAEYEVAFQQARVVNTLWSAMDPDPQQAAGEALYEGLAATNDLPGLKALVGFTP